MRHPAVLLIVALIVLAGCFRLEPRSEGLSKSVMATASWEKIFEVADREIPRDLGPSAPADGTVIDAAEWMAEIRLAADLTTDAFTIREREAIGRTRYSGSSAGGGMADPDDYLLLWD